MGLEGVVRGKKQPPRIVVYGPPKIGKSTLGSETPSPVFVTTEDGVDNLPVDQFPVTATWDEFVANVKSVAEDDHEYKTLVIDTLNGAVDLAAQAVCLAQFKNDWGKFHAYGGKQGWGSTSDECRKLLPLLDACRQRGMTILLLAHTGVQNVKDPIQGDYNKFAPDLDKRVWARFSAWSDVILRADYEYAVLKLDDNKQAKGRAVGSSTRILIASGSAAEDAGCRGGYELQETLPLSWSELAEALGKDSATLPEVQARWHLLNESDQQKAMQWLGVKDLSEATVAKLRQLLNRLKKREVETDAA